jgi:hypothetical protein
MPQLYYRGDVNQRLQHGTADDIIDVDWTNRLGQDQNHLWRRFHQLSAVDRQHIINDGLDFQLIPELEEQIHRLAPRASLLDLLQTARVAGEHLNFQESREWRLHLGDAAVGYDYPISDTENPRVGLHLSSDSSSAVSSLSDNSDESPAPETELIEHENSRDTQPMSPLKLMQWLSNLSAEERTGEKDISVLFDLHRAGKIDAQTVSAWMQAIDIGQMGHFLGLEINVRAFNDVE